LLQHWLPSHRRLLPQTVACTGDNFRPMTDRMTTNMPYGSKRTAIMREIAVVNTDLSDGDMGKACTRYAIALRIQNNVRDPFEDLHLE
jgi:hypothetical protein